MQIKPQDRYKTILVIVTGLMLLSFLFAWPPLLYISTGIGVLCIFSSTIARWVERGWLKLAIALGWINSRVILSIIYFVFLLPLAWVSRLFTKDPLALRRRKTATLFVDREHTYTKKDLENIW